MSECVFCGIVAGTIPSTVVAESDRALAIADLAPQAPVHDLVMPKAHLESADFVRAEHDGLVDEMILLAQRVVEVEGVRERGYRLVFNVGADAMMTVAHLHLHVLGGRPMGWPPG
jgi:histidine triad (HIT) family protein